ncbi:MAG: hypothetical protein ORN83_10960 [Chthoniobacteraceae bacterium]|nr:hypothetical protein [Chthoniobacteraceae bacterium]
MIALAALPSFTRMFPNFRDQCVTLYTLLLPIAGLLLVIGIVAEVQHSRAGRSMLRLIATTLLLTMTIAFFGEWTDMAKDAMQTVTSKMSANPEDAARRYIEVLVSKEMPRDKSGWFGLPNSAEMYEAVLWGILSLVGLIAQFVIWGAYILQQFFVGLSFAFAPLFIGMLALRSTSHIGARYILGTLGIIAWPLGWAAASIGTSNLIDLATEQGLLVVSNVYGLQTILAGAVIGGWIILTTLIAPVIIQSAVATGAQVGGALLGGALSAGAAALSGGATAAATVATGGAGALVMAAAAGAGATSSLAGAAMHGGGPAMSGGTMAGIAQSFSGSGSGPAGGASKKFSGTGSQSCNNSFNASDATKDGEVQTLLSQSKSGHHSS